MKALGLAACLLFVAAHAIAQEPRPAPETPAAVSDLVLARPFTLERGYQFDWMADGPVVRSGTVVVLEVDPELVVPRNAPEPVLYAGDRTVQRLNHGHESGHVIGIIPGEVDLTRTPIWFGRPDLPERVTAQTIRSERALAAEAKIEPFAARQVRAASEEPIRASDLASLLRDYVADLVLEFSPEERHLAETWRLPVARAPPRQQ